MTPGVRQVVLGVAREVRINPRTADPREIPMKVLKSFEFKTRSIGEKEYDWDTLLDGEIRQLEAGVDYTAKNQTLRMMAAKQAQKRGMRVKVNAVEGGLVLQAFPNGETTTETKETPKRKKGGKS
jgi:hypothetical protein